jgi:Na+-driven multidrug efflux pump
MKSAHKVIYNTGFQYIKMLVSIIISLYTTRLVLNALGIIDYGIFSLIGGVIAFLSFLNGAMSSSSQRFIAVYLGKGNIEKLKAIFKSSIEVHLVVGVLLIIILEISGLFLFNGFLNIPPGRTNSAYLVFHFMVISTFITINSVPFDALINAHEDLLFDSIAGIFDALVKLGFAIWLTLANTDLLILYGILTASRTTIFLIIKSFFCYIRYSESRGLRTVKVGRNQISEQLSFAGWNLFGSMAAVSRNQGFAVILNLFFGVAVNAAFAIANQVAGQLRMFCILMIKAINPQIMKSEGANNRERSLKLSMIASKFSFYIMAFLSIPLIFEMGSILKIWLNEIPDYSIMFCNLVIITILINQLTVGLGSALQATGKIKKYQTIIGSLIILNLPIAYILLEFGFGPYSVLASSIVTEVVACFIRVYLLNAQIGLSFKEYVNRVILRSIIPVIISVTVSYLISTYFYSEFRFIYTILFSSITFLSSIYLFGLVNDEKKVIKELSNKLSIPFASKSIIEKG